MLGGPWALNTGGWRSGSLARRPLLMVGPNGGFTCAYLGQVWRGLSPAREATHTYTHRPPAPVLTLWPLSPDCDWRCLAVTTWGWGWHVAEISQHTEQWVPWRGVLWPHVSLLHGGTLVSLLSLGGRARLASGCHRYPGLAPRCCFPVPKTVRAQDRRAAPRVLGGAAQQRPLAWARKGLKSHAVTLCGSHPSLTVTPPTFPLPWSPTRPPGREAWGWPPWGGALACGVGSRQPPESWP